jgi:hypothetical protein
MSKRPPQFRSTFLGADQRNSGHSSLQGFDDLVGMMRANSSDADSIALAESMGKLAGLVEDIAPMLQSPQTISSIGPKLVALLNELRQHKTLVLALDMTWRELPEYANYTVALNNFRLLLNQWLMERSVRREEAVQFDDFEALAWRTLGDGMLLMDMHRQLASRAFSETSQAELEPQRTEQASNWWKKLRGA